jgi:hypothetical protein
MVGKSENVSVVFEDTRISFLSNEESSETISSDSGAVRCGAVEMDSESVEDAELVLICASSKSDVISDSSAVSSGDWSVISSGDSSVVDGVSSSTSFAFSEDWFALSFFLVSSGFFTLYPL